MTTKQILDEIEKECPNCGGGGNILDIDRWVTTSQSQKYWEGKPGQSPIISRSICPVCHRPAEQRLKVKEIISSIGK